MSGSVSNVSGGGDTLSTKNNQTGNSPTQTALVGLSGSMSGSTAQPVFVGVQVGDVTASATSGTAATLKPSAYGISGSTVAVDYNAISAMTNANSANNAVSAAVTGTLAGSGSSVQSYNNQQALGNTALAEVANTTVGVSGGTVSSYNQGVTNSVLGVSNNSLLAQSVGNIASNGAVASGSTALIDTATSPVVTTQNVQNASGGSFTAAMSGVTIGVSYQGFDQSTVNVDNNTLAIKSFANYVAANSATLSAPVISMAGSGSNNQTNSAAVTASGSGISVGVKIGGTTPTQASTPVSVSGNAVQAVGVGNQASNSTTATAAATLDGTASTPTLATTSQQQNNSGAVINASLSTVNVGETSSASSSASGGALNVNNNTVSAAGLANVVNNTVSLSGASVGATSGVTAEVSNTQGNVAAVSGSLSGVNVGVQPSTGTTMQLTALNGSVSNNALNAQAGGNTATNALNATASASLTGGASPAFQVVNGQTNTGPVTASVSGAVVGNWAGGTAASYYNGATLAVASNTVGASAYGNSATNTLGVSALVGAASQATTRLVSAQVNTANVSATVDNAYIGVGPGSSTNVSGNVATVAGNTVSAGVVGNSAVNQIAVRP